MNVSSRARSQSSGRRPPPGGLPDEAVGWVLGLTPLLTSADPKLRAHGQRLIREWLAAARGPYLGADVFAAALRAQLDGGCLARCPEARLELGRWLAAFDRDGATRELLEASRTAASLAESDQPTDRERARVVNEAASRIFYELGDSNRGGARYAVSRFYSTPPSRRFKSDLIPYVQGNAANTRPGPSMHAPDAPVEVPLRLRGGGGGEPDPPVPEEMEGEPVRTMVGLDALNALGAWVGACRDLCALAGFLERCERAHIGRNYLRAPLRPDEVRELRRAVESELNGPSAERRAAALRIARSIDFALLEECSRAYWGGSR